jgi:hypothetical protein
VGHVPSNNLKKLANKKKSVAIPSQTMVASNPGLKRKNPLSKDNEIKNQDEAIPDIIPEDEEEENDLQSQHTKAFNEMLDEVVKTANSIVQVVDDHNSEMEERENTRHSSSIKIKVTGS